jgi:hypothetical protein
MFFTLLVSRISSDFSCYSAILSPFHNSPQSFMPNMKEANLWDVSRKLPLFQQYTHRILTQFLQYKHQKPRHFLQYKHQKLTRFRNIDTKINMTDLRVMSCRVLRSCVYTCTLRVFTQYETLTFVCVSLQTDLNDLQGNYDSRAIRKSR